jgi:Putative beta-lactamase-inhibitor-like, PepSY-like
MKKVLIAFLLVTGVSLGVNAQEKDKDVLNPADVPQAIQDAFKSAYADATDVQWKLKNNMYKAKFKRGETKHLAQYDATGALIAKGMVIPTSEVPAAVTGAVQAANANLSIEEVYKIEKGTEVNYLVKMSGTPEKVYLYTADGKLVKEEEKVATKKE